MKNSCDDGNCIDSDIDFKDIVNNSECPPSVLYKYFPPSRINFFNNPMLRFTPTEELNDPFEATLGFGMYPEEIFLPSKYGIKLMSSSVLGCRRSLKLWEEVDQGGYPGWAKGLAGILCLSASNNESLMWSHYADAHRGFVVGFDTAHNFFYPDNSNEAPIRRLFRVKYLDKRPDAKECRFNNYIMLYLKSNRWRYEDEWRIVKRINDVDCDCLCAVQEDLSYTVRVNDEHLAAKINNDFAEKYCVSLRIAAARHDAGLSEIEASAVKEVYVGFKASDRLEYVARSFCDKNGIQCYKKKLSERTYELENEEGSIEAGTGKNVELFSPGQEFEIRYANAESFVLNKKGPV